MEFNQITHAQIQWFHQKYVEYVKELSHLIVQYGNPWDEPTPWYIETGYESFIASEGNNRVGFFIVGWGETVDDDVDSEILELTVFPEYRRKGYGRLIALAAYRRLWGRRGWQVYRDNSCALNFWNSFCESQDIPVRCDETLERNIPVVKYRIVSTR